MNIDQIMRTAPVIPVLVLEGDGDWTALAETFVGAGLPVLEITLRTSQALDAIRQMSTVPGAIVGAGTVLNEAQLAQAIDAGSRFIVSPGLTNTLALAARDTGIAYLPGVATAGDIMRGIDLGLDRFIAKGRFERRMDDMPVRLITHPQPGLFGAAAAFARDYR